MSRSGKRWRLAAAALGAVAVLSAAALGVALNRNGSNLDSRPPGERPELLLLTSLPVLFPEELTLSGGGSPALEALNGRYRVTAVSTTDPLALAGKTLLLMAQPQAQTAENLVALDDWVRDGGHVLLLADPALEWPSKLPLGDLRRPAFGFADTGLLGHWGLRLDLPERLGPATVEAGGHQVKTASPGTLAATGPLCSVGSAALVARCTIGRGKATVIADADFLNIGAASDSDERENLGLLMAELSRIEP